MHLAAYKKNFLTVTVSVLLLCVYVFHGYSGALPNPSNLWRKSVLKIEHAEDSAVTWWKGRDDVELALEGDKFSLFNRKYLGVIGNLINYWQDVPPDWAKIGEAAP